MPSLIVVGGFYGDEGKGKIISYISKKDDSSIAVRGGVGPNAGHSIVWEGKTYRLRMLPSAFVNPRTRLLVGPGVLVNPQVFLKEVEEVGARAAAPSTHSAPSSSRNTSIKTRAPST
jgi:adenylosuccinate synthase